MMRWMLRRWLALRLLWAAAWLTRGLLAEARGWPPWVCFYLALPLVRGLCRLACLVGPRGGEEE